MLTGKIAVDPERHYSIEETTKLLGMCRRTLRKYTKQHDILVDVHASTGKQSYKGSEIKRFFESFI